MWRERPVVGGGRYANRRPRIVAGGGEVHRTFFLENRDPKAGPVEVDTTVNLTAMTTSRAASGMYGHVVWVTRTPAATIRRMLLAPTSCVRNGITAW